MKTAQKIISYIEKHRKWKPELVSLRSCFLSTELSEDWKWGSPAYTFNGKLVAGFSAFKNHFAIWFFQGVFLKDPQAVLVNAQEGVTRGLRQWRFEEGDRIDREMVVAYLNEAIANCKEGKEIKPKRNDSPIILPEALKAKLEEDKPLHIAFSKLTTGRQREYAEFIKTARQEATKLRRLEKIIPMIRKGTGLNDKYR